MNFPTLVNMGVMVIYTYKRVTDYGKLWTYVQN